MKRRSIACWIFGLLVLLILSPLPVSAVSNTILKTSVPNFVTLCIEITGKGSVWIGNQKYVNSQSVAVPRNEEVVVSVQSAAGYRLSSITLNGSDIRQQLNNSNFVINRPNQDMTLSVVFLRKSAIWPGMNPPTGDYQIRIVFGMFIFSLALLLLMPMTKKPRK